MTSTRFSACMSSRVTPGSSGSSTSAEPPPDKRKKTRVRSIDVASRSRIARPAAKLPLSGTGCPRGFRGNLRAVRTPRLARPQFLRCGNPARAIRRGREPSPRKPCRWRRRESFERGEIDRGAIHENARACAVKLAVHRRGNIDSRKRLAKNLQRGLFEVGHWVCRTGFSLSAVHSPASKPDRLKPVLLTPSQTRPRLRAPLRCPRLRCPRSRQFRPRIGRSLRA